MQRYYGTLYNYRRHKKKKLLLKPKKAPNKLSLIKKIASF